MKILMNSSLERTLRRGMKGPIIGNALPIRLLPKMLGERVKPVKPLAPISVAAMFSTRYEHPAPVLFAAGPSTLPADYFFVYPKVAFSGSGPEGLVLERVCVTARSVY